MSFAYLLRNRKASPSKISESYTKIASFRGLDLGHSALNVDMNRSPDAKNMLRDEIGQIRKRMGYYLDKSFSGAINGAFEFDNHMFVHSGTKLYLYDTSDEIGTMANAKSQGWTLNGKLYILDGEKLRTLSSHSNYRTATTTISGGSVSVDWDAFFTAWATYFPNTKLTAAQHTITFNGTMWSVSVGGTSCVLGTTEQMGTNMHIVVTGTPVSGNTITIDTQGYELTNIESDSNIYIPTVIISRNPTGGGTTYEGYNLINGKFKNSFYVSSSNASAKNFQLTMDTLDTGSESDVVVQVMDSNGNFITKTLTTDYSVNTNTGIITFVTAPGASPISGVDNVLITAKKTNSGYLDMINHCTISILYGLNGEADRLFVSGNPSYPNRDWFSAVDNPTYFGDSDYSSLGQSTSKITGYSIVNSTLATHKGDAEDGQTVYIRQGYITSNSEVTIGGETTDTSLVEFRITNTLVGQGDIAPASHNYLGNEPLYLTKNGIYAITNQDVTGQKITQSRSYYLDAKLTKEANLENACAVVYNNFYMLFINNNVYCLDFLQKSYEKNEPYSNFQYEGYLLTNIPARVAWLYGGILYFGTSEGKVCKFYTDKNSTSSYSDNIMLDDSQQRVYNQIESYWTTPYISGTIRHNKKNFTYFSTTLAPAVRTGLTLYGKKEGWFNKLFEDYDSVRWLDFNDVDFGNFTFSTDTSPRNIHKKIWIGVVDKTQFKLENNQLNQPFGIYDMTIEFTESGKF